MPKVRKQVEFFVQLVSEESKELPNGDTQFTFVASSGDGHEYAVQVTGPANSIAHNFVGALQAAAVTLAKACGGSIATAELVDRAGMH